MNNEKTITCVNCGHMNYVSTQPVPVLVQDLQPSDKGLLVDTPDRLGVIMDGFKLDHVGKDYLYSFDYYDPSSQHDMFNNDSGRVYVRDNTTVITVYRPITQEVDV